MSKLLFKGKWLRETSFSKQASGCKNNSFKDMIQFFRKNTINKGLLTLVSKMSNHLKVTLNNCKDDIMIHCTRRKTEWLIYV